MSYKHKIEKHARKFIISQPSFQQVRIINAIGKLPYAGDIKPVLGQTDVFRLRVGDFRIIFHVDKPALLVTVYTVGNRGQIYK